MTFNQAPQNLLLRAARGVLPATLQHVVYDSGQTLWEAGGKAPFAFFPLRGVVSLQVAPSDGKRVEVAMVGREGFAGLALTPRTEEARFAAVALSSGEGLIMSKEAFRRRLDNRQFRSGIERFSRLFVTIISHILACNRVHVIEKICIGRLLLIQDRTLWDTMQLTQDMFARDLGVRRATVSRAVTGLQRAGIISYDRRGKLTIVDRRQLERLACSCYHTIKAEFDEHVEGQGGF